MILDDLRAREYNYSEENFTLKQSFRFVVPLAVAALVLNSCSMLDTVFGPSGPLIEPHQGSWVEVNEYRHERYSDFPFPEAEPTIVIDTVISTVSFENSTFTLEVFGPNYLGEFPWGFRSDTLQVYYGRYTQSDDSLFLEYSEPFPGKESFGYSITNDTMSLVYQSVVGFEGDSVEYISPGTRVWGFYNFFKTSGRFTRTK